MMKMNIGPPSEAKASGSQHKMFARGYVLPLVLVTALFFLWGIPNNLNDVLIKQFMKSFAISRFQAGLVQSAFYLGYFCLSIPAALIMRRFGYKTGLVMGLFLYGVGTFLFWPAAVVRSYGFFLFGLFVIASGLSFLETGANPFVAQLGDPESSERRLNFAQAFNPLGSIVGVLIGTTFIFSGIELSPAEIAARKAAGTYNLYLQHETMRVITPYLVLGCVVFLWAVLLMRTKFPPMTGDEAGGGHGSFRELFKYSHFIQAVFAQFFYVGAQVGTWSYFIQYIQDYVHGSEKTAGYFLTGTLVAFGVGRFAATYFMRFVRPNVLMGIYSVANVVLVAIGVFFPGWFGLWAIFLTSFFMSVMYPTIFALGVDGFNDSDRKLGASLLVMAIIGGAVLTALMGAVSDAAGIARAMLVPLGCFVAVLVFAMQPARSQSA